MIPLSIYIIQHLQKLSGGSFAREQILAYRRLISGRSPVFSPEQAKQIKNKYPAAQIESLFFSTADGGLTLKKEVAVSERQDNNDLDTVLEIMLAEVWQEKSSLQELKKNKGLYQELIQRIYDPQVIILKYPPATVTSRKRQLQTIMNMALDQVYGEA